MKKRTLALALALGCVFMSPTLSYGEENAEVVSEIEEDSSTDEGNNNSWGKVAVVDDFGDATGQSVISTVVSGTFSNTATTGSDVLVTAYINFDEYFGNRFNNRSFIDIPFLSINIYSKM